MLVPFAHALEKHRFVKRYKRFFVDVEDETGRSFPVHCANSGSMKSCLLEGCDAYILDSHNPERKLRHSLELLRLEDGLACLNTQRANDLVHRFLSRPDAADGAYEADASRAESQKAAATELNPAVRNYLAKFEGSDLFQADFLHQSKETSAGGGNPLLSGVLKKEAKFNEGTRFDFSISGSDPLGPVTWIEVKSVSLRLDSKTLAFPDAVTERGQKHLHELMNAVKKGDGAFLFFVIMRGSDLAAKDLAATFRAAHQIDPQYAELLNTSVASGVKVRVLVSDIKTGGLGIRGYFEKRFS